MKRILLVVLAVGLPVFAATPLSAQFIVIGKSLHHQQTSNADPALFPTGAHSMMILANSFNDQDPLTDTESLSGKREKWLMRGNAARRTTTYGHGEV